MERALDEHLRAESDLHHARPPAQDAVAALTMLARAYSSPGGLIVKVGSRMVDSSLRTKLNSIKFAMKEAR